MFESEDSGLTLFGHRIRTGFNGLLPQIPIISDVFLNRDDEVATDDPHENDAAPNPKTDTKNQEKPDKIIACARCDSTDTKFCYFNNYNVNQPRHFCKKCQRYWTSGGSMRTIPVGAGRRKIKPLPTSPNHQILQSADTCADVDSASSEVVVPSVVHCYPWPVGPGSGSGFYPTTMGYPFMAGGYWGCVPLWAGHGSGTLGKHGRDADADSGEEAKSENCIVAPKILRMDDPDAGSRRFMSLHH